MYIYRCCKDEEIKSYKNNQKYYPKLKSSGSNTFNYDKKQCIHFFMFAETAELYKQKKYEYMVKNVIQCNIPYEILKRYLGYGYYEILIPGYYTPMPEFAIPIENFDLSTICDISNSVKEEWKRTDAFSLYKSIIPKEYLANYEYGRFQKGYDEKSVLNFDMDKFINENIEQNKHL